MDALTRRKLVRLASEKSFEQIDVPQITLGLLNGTTKTEFSNEKSYIQWKNRQVIVTFGFCFITCFFHLKVSFLKDLECHVLASVEVIFLCSFYPYLV